VTPSSVDLAKHDVERADDRRNVGKHVAAAQEVHGFQMGERRGADLALVRPVGSIRDQIDPELALLDRA
jgi:hypothetical protein